MGKGIEGQLEAFERNHYALLDICCDGWWGGLLEQEGKVEELLLSLLISFGLLLKNFVWLFIDKLFYISNSLLHLIQAIIFLLHNLVHLRNLAFLQFHNSAHLLYFLIDPFEFEFSSGYLLFQIFIFL